MYAVQTADAGELTALRQAAGGGRLAAMSRRRAVSTGQAGLGPAQERVRTGVREAEIRGPAATNGTAPAASNGREAPTAPVATNGSAPVQSAAPATAPAANGAVAEAHVGRALSRERRRQVSQGKGGLTGGAGAPFNGGAPVNGHVAPAAAAATNGSAPVQATAPAANGAVAEAHVGRALSRERRRQVSQGKQGIVGAAVPAPPAPAPSAPAPSAPAANGAVAEAHIGRALSRERRRQVSQGKQGIVGAAVPAPPAPAPSAPAPAPADTTDAVRAPTGRQQARARRAEASRYGGAAYSRPQREGQVPYAPKVIVSPTHGGQRVTGLRIGPGVRVTGDEPGSDLPVSGTQYVAADGPPPPPGAGRKVGLVRTNQGLVVSGTTVRGKVPITGDEFGEHLRITGEADQKLDDDLTPRREGSYQAVQFPRRTDPHGQSAVGTRLAPRPGPATSGQEGPWHPLETSDGGLAVTGTAVGRSGRVTGNEAGACRPVTGDQYQGTYSSECGGTGGGTAPAAHVNRARLDPVTAGKVTVAQTWAGQRVTGPSVEHRPNVTGDEPGSCHPLTGTPYQGPSTAYGWCEPDEGDLAAQRLDPRPAGVAVTGNVPMHAKAVTGTERGHRHAVTGTPYYSDLRAAEPAADDWNGSQAFPVAWARRLAAADGDEPAADTPPAPPSTLPGRITGSFAVGDGMVTGNNEFLFRPRANRGEGKQPQVTGEGRTEGRTVTGSAWTINPRVTGTEGYIAARRNPSEGGGHPHGWAGAGKFRDKATPGAQREIVTGRAGWSPSAARITLSGGAQG
ncbi:MAG TPA: CsoS2 family carboxysome shell protein [Acidimicrobiales bacterium]|nr:CsoS2 family carboxysome shell protein [Acidimicrobiales bacterium]